MFAPGRVSTLIRMSDLEITRTETLTREDAAKLLAAIAEALASGGTRMQLSLGDSRLTLRVPDQVRVEVELEVEDGEVELECELGWSLPRSRPAPRKQPSNARPAASR